MLRSLTVTTFLLISAINTVSAATLVEVKDENNGRTQIMTDGKKARMDMGEDGSYMVIDYDKHTVYAVLPEQQQIMDLSSDMPAMGGAPAEQVRTELTPAGNGPVIAGYATRKYSLKANGQYCGTIYGSKEAMQATGISQLFDAMKRMIDKQRAAMGSYASMMDACTRADMDFASLADTVGVPMKMLDDKGNNASEIISINTSASLPADAFALPASYKKVTMGEQVRQAQQGMDQLQQQMPQIEEALKQMQQQGGLPPEAMEQLKRYQQMMQQQ